MAEDHEISVFSNTLFKFGLEKNKLKELSDEYNNFVTLINKDKTLVKFLQSPKITGDEKKAFIKKVLGKDFSELFIGFLNVVLHKRSQRLLEKIYKHFQTLVDQHENVERGKIISAQKLDQKVLDQIEQTVSKRINKRVILTPVIDETILGGLVLQVGDKRVDLSISNNLEKMKDKILNLKVEGAIS